MDLDVLKRLYRPEVFGKLLKRYPYSAQEVAMLCPHRNIIEICGRGVGKSKVLTGDDEARRSVMLPWLRAALTGSRSPIPYLALLLAAVKDQAFELQESIRQAFERDDWLHAQLDPASTKTNLLLRNGARILIRAATHAARGLHAETLTTADRRVVKGIVSVRLDEGWFLTQPSFISEVLRPMMLMGGRGSRIVVTSTPFGKQGELWNIYDSPTTGVCGQPYSLDEFGRRIYRFDREICRRCVATYRTVRHSFPSWENPHADLRELLDTKRDLQATGRGAVWTQEYEGTPESTAGLFFNERHHELIWDDELPEYRISNDGEFVKRTATVRDGAMEEPISLREEFRAGEFYLGYDASQGIDSNRADYSALSLIEIKAGIGVLRMCQRWRVPPAYFGGRSYGRRDLTQFLIDVICFMIDSTQARKVYVDQGFGQAVYNAVMQKYGEHRVEYVRSSQQEKNRSLLHLRGMAERGRFRAPPIGFLVGETRYLQIDQDALEDDRVKIAKTASWGKSGTQVDGIFSTAYAMRGTEQLVVEAYGARVQQMELLRPFGPLRSLPFRRARAV